MLCDVSVIELYTQRSGGHCEHQGSTVLFWIPDTAEIMFVCAWPDLLRRADLDLI
jgi:hypothetical protein